MALHVTTSKGFSRAENQNERTCLVVCVCVLTSLSRSDSILEMRMCTAAPIILSNFSMYLFDSLFRAVRTQQLMRLKTRKLWRRTKQK